MKKKVLSMVILVAMVVTLLPTSLGIAAPAANMPVWQFQSNELSTLGNGDKIVQLAIAITHTDNFLSGSLDFVVDTTKAKPCKATGVVSANKNDFRTFATMVDNTGATVAIDANSGGWWDEGSCTYQATTNVNGVAGEFYLDGLIISPVDNPGVLNLPPDYVGNIDAVRNDSDLAFPVPAGGQQMYFIRLLVPNGVTFNPKTDINFAQSPNLNIVCNLPIPGTGTLSGKGLEYVSVLGPVQPDVVNHFSGTVSLPNGWTAPAGGMAVSVKANGALNHGQDITIPAGQSSAPYAFDVLTFTDPEKDQAGVETGAALTITASTTDSRFTSPITLGTETLVKTGAGATFTDIGAFAAKAITVSGTISLPNGDVAPAGGLSLTVGKNTAYAQNITIAADSSSAPYSFTVSGASAISAFDLYVDVNGSNKYITPELIGNVTNINGDVTLNKTLGKSPVISGTVSLPNGDTAAADINLKVYATNNAAYAQDITIPAGGTSAAYSFTISGTSTVSLNLSVDVKNDIKYISTQSIGSADNTQGDVTKDITLAKSTVISGTISIPNSGVAPAGGINLRVYASNNAAYSQDITIAEGAPSASYAFYIPTTSTVSLNLCVEVKNNSAYIATETIGAANNTAGDVIKDKVLEPIPTTITVSGTITLPNGQAAPEGGLDVSIVVTGGEKDYINRVLIAAGNKAVNYSIDVNGSDPQKVFKVYYYINNVQQIDWPHNYVKQWTVNGALDLSSALPVTIDITIKEVATISGTITLPYGDLAPIGGMKVTVVATNSELKADGANLNYYAFCVIDEGDSAGTYTLKVRPDETATSLKVYYYIDPIINPTLTYVQQRTIGAADTDKVVVGMDTTLLRERTIKGTINLPAGKLAAAGEKVTVIATATDGQGKVKNYYAEATFEENATSAEYTIKINAEDTLSNNFVLWYYVQDANSLYVRSSINTSTPTLSITSMVANVTGKDFDLVLK